MNTQQKTITLTNEKGISYYVAEQHKDNHKFIRNHIINYANIYSVETIYEVGDKVYCLHWGKKIFI